MTSPLRTVLDCARTLPFAEALAVTDSALRREEVTAAELHDAVSTSRAKGVRAARAVVAAADGRAANPFESGLRAAVLLAGVAHSDPQLQVSTPCLEARVDLGDPALRMVLEAESYAFHWSRCALDRDCRRYSRAGPGGLARAQVLVGPGDVRAGWIARGRARHGRAGDGASTRAGNCATWGRRGTRGGDSARTCARGPSVCSSGGRLDRPRRRADARGADAPGRAARSGAGGDHRPRPRPAALDHLPPARGDDPVRLRRAPARGAPATGWA